MGRNNTKLTQQEYEDRVHLFNPELVILGEYINGNAKILVEDEFGICNVAAKSMFSHKPSFKTAIDKNSYRLNQLKAMHNNKYTYDEDNFNCRDKKITVICPIHGEYKQVQNIHLYGGGCPKCYADEVGERFSDTVDSFISKSKDKFDDKFEYSKVIYKSCDDVITLNCKVHGDFITTPRKHLSSHYGCPTCGKSQAGWSRSDYINRANGRLCTLYTLELWDDIEKFYKIGITSTSLEERFRGNSKMPYSYKVLSEIKGSAEYIWNLEKELHILNKENKYKPLQAFNGYTECFNKIK